MLDPFHLFLLDPEGEGNGEGEGGGTGEESQEESGQESQEGNGAGSGSGADKDTVPKSELTKANREAGKYRTDLRKAEARIKELEDASKSDQEKLVEQNKTLTSEKGSLQETNRRLRAQVIAPRVGISADAAAQDAASLLDWSQIEDPDDDAQVEAALRDLVKDRQYLLGNIPGGADGGEGGQGGGQSQDMNSLLRQAAGKAA
jgi:hypothetical protein